MVAGDLAAAVLEPEPQNGVVGVSEKRSLYVVVKVEGRAEEYVALGRGDLFDKGL